MEKKADFIDPICAERVKEVRTDSKLKNYEFAESVFTTAENMSRVINGKQNLSVDLAQTISDVYGVRLDWLLHKDDFKTVADLETHYRNKFADRNNALQIILDDAVTEVCLREDIKPPVLDNIPEMLLLMAQIKDYADSLVWQYLIHRKHSSTWGFLDQRED